MECNICRGEGFTGYGKNKKVCSECKGSKVVTCPHCNGSGKCQRCKGEGKI
jgi:hypothetical protein